MRYAAIKYNDVANAPGISLSFFTQGCPHHCKNCFNPETWNPKGGKEFSQKTLNLILEKIRENGINRSLCLLGGDPLTDYNLNLTYLVISSVKKKYPDTLIYIWTGYLFEELIERKNLLLNRILGISDFLIDGPFIEELKNLNLPMRGSSNQRIINLTEKKKNGIIIYKR